MPVIIGIIVALVVAVMLGVALVIGLDYAARGFLWILPISPVGGWLLLGAVIGGLVGMAIGFRRGGRPLGALGVMAPVALLVVLVVAGSAYPRAEGDSAPVQSWIFQVRVTAEDLNIRQQPDRESVIIGRVHEGAVLQVAESSGEWYRVLPGAGMPGGWVNGKYTYRL